MRDPESLCDTRWLAVVLIGKDWLVVAENRCTYVYNIDNFDKLKICVILFEIISDDFVSPLKYHKSEKYLG